MCRRQPIEYPRLWPGQAFAKGGLAGGGRFTGSPSPLSVFGRGVACREACAPDPAGVRRARAPAGAFVGWGSGGWGRVRGLGVGGEEGGGGWGGRWRGGRRGPLRRLRVGAKHRDAVWGVG